MAWGAPRGIDDLVERVGRSDPSLTSLCVLRMRRVDDDGCRRLAEALAGNTVLQELSLASHALSPAAAAAFAAALGTNRTLRSLDLGNSGFGDEGLEALAPGIAASPSLRCLNLEGKGITAAGCRALRDAAAERSSSSSSSGNASSGSGGGLEELLVGRNAIGGDGLAALLAAFGSSLVCLDVSGCSLAGDTDLAPLAKAFAAGGLPLLRTLRLDGNELSGAAQLGDSLAAAASSGSGGGGLQHLHLQRCGLGDSAAARLAAALPSGLATLDLSGNAIGGEGAAALAAALSEARRQLSKLVLCSCGLDDAGMEALAAALGDSSSSAAGGGAAADASSSAAAGTVAGLALDLSGNVAGPAAVAALAAAPLATLCLHDCQLGSGEAAGAAALTQQLATAGSFAQLQELDISANHLESAQLLPLLEALAQAAEGGGNPAACPSLRLLVIAANPGAASEEVSAAVERLQERRPGLDVVRRAADTGEGGLVGR
ncbi:hypothetical protein C2E21_5187 [Chlorella sorokiniana]|uniref:Uncharacterized protein n=1 Tax=Chlorella sorokiniana TaxID=3076 RepID=A0A2P6TPR6_CHLSO|nr:hypothetical protein C2E21_5187 [Chlorella sorokiniana]|eukprot:PRW56025.1 hypothetical protein C2E21_5187 [Chlorella sorokiniana]